MNNSKLVVLLTEQTQSLKEQYVAKCIEWAKVRYDRLIERSKWRELQWCEYYGLEPRVANPGTSIEFKTFPNGFFNTKAARIYERDRTEAKNTARISREDYLKTTEKNAIQHYTDSIEKLAGRIAKKGLNEDTIQLHTSHVGVNIETMITDGTKTVKAWTIIASGVIQQPHYRYLIK